MAGTRQSQELSKGSSDCQETAPAHSEDPPPPEVEHSLCSSFAARHKLTIPSALVGALSWVGHLHRELQSRNMVLLPLHKL
eukprot:6287001-Karenia_brevis.AAC.1